MLEEPIETLVPTSQRLVTPMISWARGSYYVTVESDEAILSKELFLAELHPDGSAVHAPITLGRGWNRALMTSVDQDALIMRTVHAGPQEDRGFFAVIVHEGTVSDPIALPLLDVGLFNDSELVLASSGDRAYLAWAVHNALTQEQRIFGVLLDRNAHLLEPVRELALETGSVYDLSVTFDDAGVVFAYAQRDLASTRQLVLQRLTPIGAESTRVIFAEGITTPGIGISVAGPNSVLVAYPRFGQIFGGRLINRTAAPARVMGRFVYLPSPGPS